jgi:uncharacterized membrane protein YsdA (DUF1294 family)
VSIKSLLLGISVAFSFINFAVLPYEIVPYLILLTPLFLNERPSAYAFTGLWFILMGFLLRIVMAGTPSSDALGDCVEVLVVVILLGFWEIDRKVAEKALYVIALVWAGFGLLQVVSPDLSFVYLMRAPSAEHLAQSGRGLPFLAPEPSYAGLFLVGCYTWASRCCSKNYLPFFFSGLTLLTGSIWALLNLVVAMFVFGALRLRAAIVLSLTGVVLFSERVRSVLLKAQDQMIRGIFDLELFERNYGSKRLINNIEAWQTPITLTDWSESQAISFLMISKELGGLVLLGALIMVLVALRRMKNREKVYLLIIMILGGPVGILTVMLFAAKVKRCV